MSAPVSEQGAMLTIEAACRALRLPTVRAQAALLAEAAVRDRLTHRAYLAEVLGAELDDREARRRERRIVEAHFPRLKRLAANVKRKQDHRDRVKQDHRDVGWTRVS